MSRDDRAALPPSAMGLSAVCDCGISWSYSLTIFLSMYLDPHLNWGWGWHHEIGLSPPVTYFYWPFQGGTSFVDLLCVFCALCFSWFRVCSLLPCCHLLGKGWPLGSCWWCLLYFCYFPMWYPGSGVVLDCIVSWSLPSFLLHVYIVGLI